MFVLVFLLLTHSGVAQKYARKLHVKSGEIFQLRGKNFEIDTLILEDGAELRLDKDYRSTEIIVGYLQTGIDCLINGEGINGKHGEITSSERVRYFFGFVIESSELKSGMPGTSACHLTLFAKAIKVSGRFAINLRGGDGGNGNAKAGHGGDGGNLIFSFPKVNRESLLNNLIVFAQGGHGGQILVPNKNTTRSFATDGVTGIVEFVYVEKDR